MKLTINTQTKKQLQILLNQEMSFIQHVLLEEVYEDNYIEDTGILRDTCVRSANDIAEQESRNILKEYLTKANGITENGCVKEGLENNLDILILIDADYKLKAQSTISSSGLFSSSAGNKKESNKNNVPTMGCMIS